MTLTLYELVGRDDRRFSPYCWRSRLALAHKGLAPEIIPVKFTDKNTIAFSGQDKVPVLRDGAEIVTDSWAIARHLEDAYPEAPSLFGGNIGRGEARFINLWADQVENPSIGSLIIGDVFDHVDDADRDYFRTTREARYGRPLSEVQADREARVDSFRKGLAPLRAVLAEQPYIAGDAPAYADYAVFGGFQWARCTSSFALLAGDDPIRQWRERVLALFDGLAAGALGYDN